MEAKRLIKSKMALSGLTQKEIATKLGITEATLSRKLNNISKFSVKELVELNKMLGITFEELFPENVDNSTNKTEN